MKLLKYLAAILFILFILVNVLTRLPIVQDRIMMTALNNAVNATAELPDNALSALVCWCRMISHNIFHDSSCLRSTSIH